MARGRVNIGPAVPHAGSVQPWKCLMRRRFLVLLALLMYVSACSLNKKAAELGSDFGAGALTTFRTKGTSALDTLGAHAGEVVRGPAIALLAEVRDSANSALAGIQTDMATKLEGPINHALQKLVDDNTKKLQANSELMLGSLMLGLRTELRDELKPIIVQTAGDAVNAATNNLALAMEGALLRALTAATDSLARTATHAAAQSVEKSARESHLLRNIIIGVVAVIVLLFAFALWREKRKNKAYVEPSLDKLSQDDMNELVEKVRKATVFKFGRTELEKAIEKKKETAR